MVPAKAKSSTDEQTPSRARRTFPASHNPGGTVITSLGRRLAVLFAMSIGLSVVAAPALADDIINNLDATVDADAEVMALNVGGPNGTTTLRVDPMNLDGKNGCNLTGSTTLVVAVNSSNAGVATVSPSSVTFDSCGATRMLTVTPQAAGSTTISLSLVSNNSGGSFNLAPATFTVNVTAASNHAPSVSVTGVSKTSYELGVDTLPTPGCLATDDEDGTKHPAPTVTANRDEWGLGTVEVECSYTDAGGLTATSSATYTVVDTIKPTITFKSRTPAANADAWNNSPVTVTWTCTDTGSGVVQSEVSDTVDTDGAGQSAAASCEDHAGNVAAASRDGINVDTVDPTISFLISPAANASGWNQDDVTVSWTCDDELSGATGGGSVTLSDEGADQKVIQTCADLAGNSVTGSSDPVSIDKTAPTIQMSRAPAANSNGWNDGPVTVSWTCTDGGSGAADDGGSVTLSDDGAGQSVTRTCTDLAGNTAEDTVSDINIDKTAPTIHITRDPGPNADGWNNTDVTVTWTCADSGSGTTDGGGSVTLTDEGADQKVTRTCTDLAGNTAEDTVSDINIDKTAPTIHITRDPGPNADGWNNTDVTVTWTCTDDGSGPADDGGSTSLDGEGAGQSVEGTCTDLAGNSVSASETGIRIDKTAPTIHISKSPAANSAGWNNTDVTVSWTCEDQLSGVTTTGGSVLLSDEAENQSAIGTCTDRAGNASTDTVENVDIDKTAPAVSWNSAIPNDAKYYFGQVPSAPSCSATDALSGVTGDCSVSGYSTAVGHHTLSASASDMAGNETTLTSSYDVLAWTLKGFYQPVDMGGVWNTVKGGSTVPLKFEAFVGSSEITDVATLGATFAVRGVACDSHAEADAIEMTTTGGTTLRYDSSAGQFIQNWQTPKKAGTCYSVSMTAADGSSLKALFKLK
jgi:hypothetical protein